VNVTIRFLADEDLDADIINGLRDREPAIDILDMKDAGLRESGTRLCWSSQLSKTAL
jgi:hypothetical protein